MVLTGPAAFYSSNTLALTVFFCWEFGVAISDLSKIDFNFYLMCLNFEEATPPAARCGRTTCRFHHGTNAQFVTQQKMMARVLPPDLLLWLLTRKIMSVNCIPIVFRSSGFFGIDLRNNSALIGFTYFWSSGLNNFHTRYFFVGFSKEIFLIWTFILCSAKIHPPTPQFWFIPQFWIPSESKTKHRFAFGNQNMSSYFMPNKPFCVYMCVPCHSQLVFRWHPEPAPAPLFASPGVSLLFVGPQVAPIEALEKIRSQEVSYFLCVDVSVDQSVANLLQSGKRR